MTKGIILIQMIGKRYTLDKYKILTFVDNKFIKANFKKV